MLLLSFLTVNLICIQNNMQAMILAAGLGTRLNKLTRNRPKALVPLNGIPLIEHLIRRLRSFQITDIIINVHHFADEIISFVESKEKFGINITFSIEDNLLDTGGGVRKARQFFNPSEPFLMHNVDVLTNLDYHILLENHKKANTLATLAVRAREASRYLLFDSEMNLCGWESVKDNKKIVPAGSSGPLTKFSFMGIQIINPHIFNYFPSLKKFSIVEAYLHILKKGKLINGMDSSAYYWHDLGTPARIDAAVQFLQTIK